MVQVFECLLLRILRFAKLLEQVLLYALHLSHLVRHVVDLFLVPSLPLRILALYRLLVLLLRERLKLQELYLALFYLD